MTSAISLNGAAPKPPAAPAAGSDRARLGEAARQFEAIFLRQMLAAARSTDFDGDELFGGQGEETFREMRDSRFAEIAAGTGTLGMAASIEAQLARYLDPEN